MLASPACFLSQNRLKQVLLRELTRYHAGSGGEGAVDDAREQSHAVLRWMQEHRRSAVDDSQTTMKSRDVAQMVRRYTREDTPLAYLLGSQPFGELNIRVKPPILIPRPETEEWTIKLADELVKGLKSGHSESPRPSRPFRILDLCTGSGCIALLLASRISRVTSYLEIVGIDVNPAAIRLARRNARENGLDHLVSFQVGDIFADPSQLLGNIPSFDLIVSNPPYIPWHEYEQLERSVRDHEDPKALVGERSLDVSSMTNTGGLAFYEQIRTISPRLLFPKQTKQVQNDVGKDSAIPELVLEVGHDQAKRVAATFSEQGWSTSIVGDFAGHSRSVWLCRSS